jgi:hypothetical protein
VYLFITNLIHCHIFLVFPGSNCDRDMFNAAIKSGVEAEYVDYRETSLSGFDGVLIPGVISQFQLKFETHYKHLILAYLQLQDV